MKIVVGLGNPGERYTQTRHNVGFRALDYIVGDNWLFDKYSNSLLGKHASLPGVLFVKPQTFMNRSGEALVVLARHYEAQPEDFLIVYDDLDVPVGEIKLATKRGDGGHNGLKSIESHLKTRAFNRLRVGIQPVGMVARHKDFTRFVLQRFAPEEEGSLSQVFTKTETIINRLQKEDLTLVMNGVNRRPDSSKKQTIKDEPLKDIAKNLKDKFEISLEGREGMDKE